MMQISPKNIERLKNRWWRISHLYKVKDKQSQLVTFKPNEAQIKFIRERDKHRYVKILKSRQLGMTTYRCIELLDKAMWIQGASCAIIAHRQEDVVKIFEIVKRAYENVPEELKPKTRYDSKNEITFESDFTGRKLDSKIYVATKLRSGTVSDLHISESAYIKDRQELKAGSKQAVAKTGSIIEETTANGFNEFQEEYQKDKEEWNQDNGIPQEQKYLTLFFPWYEFKEYQLESTSFIPTPEEEELKKLGINNNQLAWRRWKISELGSVLDSERQGLSGLQLFRQEYPTTEDEAFQTSGASVISADIISELTSKKPIESRFGCEVYYEVERNHQYVIGIDTTEGTGNDFTALTILDITDMKEVGSLSDNTIRPDQIAVIAIKLAKIYNEAFIIPERNSSGLTTVLKIQELDYRNMYKNTAEDKITKKPKNEYGWRTTSGNRDLLLDEMIEIVENRNIEINSGHVIAQLKTFVRKDNGRREHEDGRHDDNIFSLSLAIQGKKFYRRGKPRTFTSSII